jgi:hypothetical protein
MPGGFDAPVLSARHSGEGRNPVKHVVRSTQHLFLNASHVLLDWIPAYAGMTGERYRLH